ncbi:zinc-binding alcohol dehydrogenase family protein [Actinocorallia sp. A-T 12471]|uniref:zinc-binding alcohol dehydrogenase family protein n=1 Tax=Actinocorallia sp. A-T 12471 TaxID=3089813 RepID=UPI0029D29EE6|nr:zinc-binding alcohol dehydrogenase family protein [Actinocorallia sp. A-T 12471]MDX6740403.1 zinc-binding alcohol dehydrogenase family protein [Actinocorallia sp. A-T 12471]
MGNSMRAVAYTRSLPVEDPDCLVDVALPVPKPGPRDLLVRIEAVAVNPVDAKTRLRDDPGGVPRVLGYDAAGTVVEVGDAVELFAPGDEVYYAGARNRQGADAEFHAVDERLVGRKPETLSFTEAAALPLTSLTAWEGLFERLGIAEGSGPGALLVTAAAGGVGAMVAQLARRRTGLTVIGTASRPETVAFAREMGCHHVVNHHEPLVPQLHDLAPDGLAYVFSTVGTARNLPAYAETLRPFGAIVAIDDDATLPLGVLKPKSVAFHWELMFTRSQFQTADRALQGHYLTRVSHLVDEGVLVTTARRDLGPLTAASLREAHRIQESGASIGKTTLTGFP